MKDLIFDIVLPAIIIMCSILIQQHVRYIDGKLVIVFRNEITKIENKEKEKKN